MSNPGRQLRLDAENGPARRLDGAKQDAIVESIVDAWIEERTATPPRRAWGPGWAAAAGLVLGFLLAGSMAAALYAISQESTESPNGNPALPRPTLPGGDTELGLPPDAIREPRPEPEVEPSRPAPEEPAPAPRSEPTADLLERANRLRGERQYADAARLYGRAASGRGRRAYVASVAAAELELEHLDRPRSALRHFQRAARLDSDGPLDLTVRSGTARAAARLGRTQLEQRALRQLVERHPDSAAAARARTRLGPR